MCLPHSGFNSSVTSVEAFPDLSRQSSPSLAYLSLFITSPWFYSPYNPQQYLKFSWHFYISWAYNQCQAHFCFSASICKSVNWTDITMKIFPCQKIFSQNIMRRLYPVALCIYRCVCMYYKLLSSIILKFQNFKCFGHWSFPIFHYVNHSVINIFLPLLLLGFLSLHVVQIGFYLQKNMMGQIWSMGHGFPNSSFFKQLYWDVIKHLSMSNLTMIFII